jgi:hypothetical protein
LASLLGIRRWLQDRQPSKINGSVR